MAWRGRQLTGYTKSGKTITMGYDADGLRSSKTVNSVKTTYQYVGDKLFYENRGNGDSFYYFYDSYGKLSAIYHHRNGTKVAYHVVTNAQGDVISLYNWSGTLVASYDYDAWGNCTITQDSSSTGIATLNPFRYRGYYYDNDLGLYYLQSRYYDSEIGRFINADTMNVLGVSPTGVIDKNLFAYCDNNPVNRADNGGQIWNVVVGAVVGGAISFVSSFVPAILDGKLSKKEMQQIAVSTVIGVVEGALVASCPAAAGIISGFFSAAETAINGIIEGESSTRDIVVDSMVSGVVGGILGSSGSDFIKGNKLINNAANSIGDAIRKGVHPSVKKAAKKTLKKAGKQITRSYATGQIEDFASSGISEFTSFYFNSIIDMAVGT